MKSDLEIAQEAKILPIVEIAKSIELDEDDLELYGKYKAKVSLDVIKKFASRPSGKYIDVTAITPTPLGEGKTVTTIGLSQGLAGIGKKVITCIRQPSLGPVFGIKGGAAGGGYSLGEYGSIERKRERGRYGRRPDRTGGGHRPSPGGGVDPGTDGH